MRCHGVGAERIATSDLGQVVVKIEEQIQNQVFLRLGLQKINNLVNKLYKHNH